VRAARLQANAQERVLREQLLDLEVGDRLPRRGRVERMARRVGAIAADRRLDPARPGPRPAAHERQVDPFELSPAHERLQAPVRLRRAGDDEEARRVAVESVDDARPVGVAALEATGEQPVDERPAPAPRCRVDDDTRRLVDDEQVVVLVRDPKLELLGLERRLLERGQLDLDLLSPAQPVRLRPRAAVDEDGAGVEQALGRRPRGDLLPACEEAVDARRPGVARNA
jgi:hypothetical protein